MSYLQYILFITLGQLLYVNGGNCKPKVNSTSIFNAEHSVYYCMFIDNAYLNFIRPVENTSLPIKVKFDLTNVELIELNSKQGRLTVQYWTRLTWKDERLTWDPAIYSGLNEITIPQELIWFPIVEMYNGKKSEDYAISKVTIYHNGTLSTLQKQTITTNCIMRMKRFPYDSQICYLQFASTSYTSKKLQLIPSYRRSKFQNIDWKVNSFFIDPNHIPSLNDNRFSVAVFSIRMTRHSSYLSNTLVLPSILISFLMCLLFFINPEIRINLSLCLFIICSLILNQVDIFLSINSGELPMIVSYIAFQMVMLTLEICMTLIVVNCISNKTKVHHVPQLIKTMLFGKICSALCLKSNRYNSFQNREGDLHWSRNVVTGVPGETDQRSNTGVVGSTTTEAVTVDKNETLNSVDGQNYQQNSLKVLKDIRGFLGDRVKYLEFNKNEGIQEMNTSEWVLLSKIIDRLCFFLFITITIVTSIAIIR